MWDPSTSGPLVENRQAELRTLDYKWKLPDDRDAARAELCKDVSSFANAVGGDLIYGLKEAEDDRKMGLGYPDAVAEVGIKGQNAHTTIERLEQILAAGIEPRISNLQFHAVEYKGGHIIVVRVPNSLRKPHMVKSSICRPFWSRHSKGAYEMDLSEIRQAFLGASHLAKQLREFQAERLRLFTATSRPSHWLPDHRRSFASSRSIR